MGGFDLVRRNFLNLVALELFLKLLCSINRGRNRVLDPGMASILKLMKD